jgi:hypothetical protein
MSGGVLVPPHEVRGQVAPERQHVIVAVNRRDLGVGQQQLESPADPPSRAKSFCVRE